MNTLCLCDSSGVAVLTVEYSDSIGLCVQQKDIRTLGRFLALCSLVPISVGLINNN